MKARTWFILFLSVFLLFSISSVSASFNFTGVVYNLTGSALNATNVSLYIYQQPSLNPTLIVSTLSNATGHFNLTVNDTYSSNTYSFRPIIKKYNSNGVDVDWIGQTLPDFPYNEVNNLGAINFYLYPAVTLNLTVVNETGGAITFHYMVKDTKLGYPVAASFDSSMVTAAILNFPSTRNYSVMIYPNSSFPLGYNLNNMSANNAYQISSGNHINLTFNTTFTLRRVSGNMSISNAANFTSVVVVPYLFESGGMVSLDHPMPYNMSSWVGGTDIYNATTGNYNITLPGAAMNVQLLLFAMAVKDGVYYGSFRNISLDNSNAEIASFNFDLKPLMGNSANIVLEVMDGNVTVATKEVNFSITYNGSALSQGSLEADLDYSSYCTNCAVFTWMADLNGRVLLPLLNTTVKKMNIYTPSAAPKKASFTAADLASGTVAVNLTAFNPGDIDNEDLSNYLEVGFYKSDSACSVPYPEAFCSLLNASDFDNFNPLTVIMGGGKIDFMIRLSSNNLTVKYIDVDLIASGPPDALFDGSANQSSSGADLDAVWRFGSNGPEIYSSILIGVPYAAAVDESAPFRVLLSQLYDENWNSIWNASDNPTGAGYNTVANTDYASFNSSWFNSSIGGMNCSLTDPNANCYVNTTFNMIWLKIPHFSGIGPTVNSITAGNVSANASGAVISCTYNCTIYINITNQNYTLAQSLQNITINNSFSSWVSNLTINRYNGSAFIFNGTNSTTHLNYNFTLSNGSSSTIHQYQIYINKSNVSTAYWNFTYNISGLGSLLTLSFNLTCVESWSCSAWSDCSSGSQTRTCTESIGCGTTVDQPTSSQSCNSGTSSSSGGSGTLGSAGGVAQSTATLEKKVWTSINSGETAIIPVKSEDIGVTAVEFVAEQKIYGAWVQVAKKESLPTGISSAAGKVYRYLEISKSTTVNEDAIKDAKIKFRVEKSWLDENKLAKEDVALLRYSSGAWKELETVVKDEDGSYINFEAATPGFSYFAIGQKSKAVVPVVEEVEEAESLPTGVPPQTAEMPEQNSKPFWPWVIAIVVIGIITYAIYWVKR